MPLNAIVARIFYFIDLALIDPCASTILQAYMSTPRHTAIRLGSRVFSRSYAVPLNPGTSFDVALGMAIPAAPSPRTGCEIPQPPPPVRPPLERYAIAAAAEVARMNPRSGCTIGHLLDRMNSRSGYQLSIELPYESTPKPERRVPITSALSSQSEISSAIDDGVVLLCFVDNVGSGAERVHMCTGFAVPGGNAVRGRDSDKGGTLIVSCSHTVRKC